MSKYDFIPDFDGSETFKLSYKKQYTSASEWLKEAHRLVCLQDTANGSICIARAMLCSPSEEDKAFAHALLLQYPAVLKSFYERVSADSKAIEVPQNLHCDILSSQQKKIVSDLHRDGIAVWRGVFANWPELQAAKEYCDQLYEEHIQCYDKFDHVEENKIQAPSVVQSALGNYEFTGEPGNEQGRYRTLFPVWQRKTGLQLVDSLIFNNQIQDVIRQYYMSEIQENYVLFETLKPGTEYQKLHIDCMGDQLKVMVFLEDVAHTDGPLVFEKGSHNTSPTLFRHLNAWFHKAPDHPSTDTQLLRQNGISEWTVTGKKGDCIFFNSHALHRGTPCSTGERRNLVLSYGASTLRSHLMYILDRSNIAETAIEHASSSLLKN